MGAGAQFVSSVTLTCYAACKEISYNKVIYCRKQKYSNEKIWTDSTDKKLNVNENII